MTSTPYNFEQLQFKNPKIQIITKFYLFTRYFVEGLRTLLDAQLPAFRCSGHVLDPIHYSEKPLNFSLKQDFVHP